MNKSYILFAFLLSGILSVSCRDSLAPLGGGTAQGDDVILQARISPDEGTTKTNYSGSGQTSGSTLVKERIDWAGGDLLRIASDQAYMRENTAQLWADYKVTTYVDANLKSQAAITPYTNNGLVWKEGVSTHRFYGMYPSPSNFSGSSNVALDPLTAADPRMHAFIPGQQYLRARGNADPDSRYFLPSNSARDTTMHYAWMFSPVISGSKSAGKKIVLDFHPVFTAFELVLDAQEEITVTAVTLTSETRPLSGNFTVKTSATFTGNWYPGTGTAGDWYPSAGSAAGGSSSTTYPVNANFPEVTATVAAQRSVTTSLPEPGILITPGSPISVTLLALPQAHKALTISVTTSKGVKKLALKLSDKTTWISWRGCRKYRIGGLVIPRSDSLTLEPESLIWQNNVLDITVVESFGWNSGLDVLFGDNMVFGREQRI